MIGSTRASASAARRRGDVSDAAGPSSASNAANSKKHALSAAYAELGKELTSGKLRSIGTYTLGRPIGEGTYGKVRLGTHRLTGLRVAIKQVPKAHSASLTREIHHHRHLHHPHIMQLYEVLATESYIWMVTELCAGGELYDYLVERGTMPEAEARRIFGQLCLAVAYVHDRGIVHRDLKLENVLLDERCNVKLGDFGFTREFEGKRLMETFCGTTGYAAPEMLAGRRYTGEEVDVWSLGIVLYALVYGALPFDDDDETIMKAKILHGEFELLDTISSECASLIKSILQQDPSKRPSIKDILACPWFAKIMVPSAAMETVDEDIDDTDAIDTQGGRASLAGKGQMASDPSGAPVDAKSSGLDQAMIASTISAGSFHSAMSQADSEASDPQSHNTDSTTPTTEEDGSACEAEKTDKGTISAERLSLQHRNESQTTIRRQASAGSEGSFRRGQLAPSKSTPGALSTHVETSFENHSPDVILSKAGLPISAPLEKRGSQGSSRSASHHRTPSRTKRRSFSGLSDHHPPSLDIRPLDYVSLLERSTPAIFSTVLEQNMLHQLSAMGMDVGQIVHSVVNEACDASGAMWWLLKRKAEEKASAELELGPASFPSSPYLNQYRTLSPAPPSSRERTRLDSNASQPAPRASPVIPLLDLPKPAASKTIDTRSLSADKSDVLNVSPKEENGTLKGQVRHDAKSERDQTDLNTSNSSLVLQATPKACRNARTSPQRSRASSFSARLSNVLSGKEKDKDREKEKENRRDVTSDASVLVGNENLSFEERSKGPVGALFGAKRNTHGTGSPSSMIEKQKRREDRNGSLVPDGRASVSPTPSPRKSTGKDEMIGNLAPSQSVETFTTVSSSGDGGEEGNVSTKAKKPSKSSFFSTVRTWLGTDEKASAHKKQRKGRKRVPSTHSTHQASSGVARSGSVRRQQPPHLYAYSGSVRSPSRGPSNRATISRHSSSGSAHYQPMVSRPVSIRRQSAGSITPTATLFGNSGGGEDHPHPVRISRPSSAQSLHRLNFSPPGLHYSESVSTASSQLRSQQYSSSSAGAAGGYSGSLRGLNIQRPSADGGTTVRRHRHLPLSRSNSGTQSRPTTPSRMVSHGLLTGEEHSVDTITPRQSIDSGRTSPQVTPRTPMGHPSVFVAHRSRTPYKPPSMSPMAHKQEHPEENGLAIHDAGLPSHSRLRWTSQGGQRYGQAPPIGTWRRSWGKPPPSWSGPVDQAKDDADGSTAGEGASSAMKDRALLRDIFAQRPADDDWEDEDDEPVYAGGLGQVASNAWASGGEHAGSGSQGRAGSFARTGASEGLVRNIDGLPLSEASSRNGGVRSLFQVPSLGRETTPRSWVPASSGDTSDLDKDAAPVSEPEVSVGGAGSSRKEGAGTASSSGAGGTSRMRSAAPSFKGPVTITEEEEDE